MSLKSFQLLYCICWHLFVYSFIFYHSSVDTMGCFVSLCLAKHLALPRTRKHRINAGTPAASRKHPIMRSLMKCQAPKKLLLLGTESKCFCPRLLCVCMEGWSWLIGHVHSSASVQFLAYLSTLGLKVPDSVEELAERGSVADPHFFPSLPSDPVGLSATKTQSPV